MLILMDLNNYENRAQDTGLKVIMFKLNSIIGRCGIISLMQRSKTNQFELIHYFFVHRVLTEDNVLNFRRKRVLKSPQHFL